MIIVAALVVVLVLVGVGAALVVSFAPMFAAPRGAATRPGDAATRPGSAGESAELQQLRPLAGLTVRSAAKGWVRAGVVAAMERAASEAAARGLVLQVLDASLAGGGPFPPHLSHQTGRDVDVRYLEPLDVFAAIIAVAQPSKVYVSRDRVQALQAAGLPAAFWPGHTKHAHLRF